MPGHHRIARRVITSGLAVALATTSVTAASVQAASGDDGARKVSFTERNPVTDANRNTAFVGDPSRCSFDPVTFALLSPCVAPVTPAPGFDGTFSGDLTGTFTSADGAVLAALNDVSATLDVPFVALTPVQVTITRCGTGSFILRTEGNLNTPNSIWSVVPGSGRGDLVGLRGHGVEVSTNNGPGGTELNSFTGRVRCGHHDDS